MNTMVILGAGQFGRACASLINTEHVRLLAFADNNPLLQGSSLGQIPILSVPDAIARNPDLLFIGVTDLVRTDQFKKQAIESGFHGTFLPLGDLYRLFDIRSAVLYRLAARLKERQVSGSVAELGVYKGAMAEKINALFPERPLYLFDTFDGFDGRDIRIEKARDCSRAQKGDFSDTSVASVLERLPFKDQAIVRKGYFPETVVGLEHISYALVSLDADLYAPLFSGLCYFYPHLSPGGMILLHDYNNTRFSGARQAVTDYETEHGFLSLLPLCDLHGSAVIVKT